MAGVSDETVSIFRIGSFNVGICQAQKINFKHKELALLELAKAVYESDCNSQNCEQTKNDNAAQPVVKNLGMEKFSSTPQLYKDEEGALGSGAAQPAAAASARSMLMSQASTQ